MRDSHEGFVDPTPANSAANSLRLLTEYSWLTLSVGVLCGTRADTRQSSEPPRTRRGAVPGIAHRPVEASGVKPVGEGSLNDGRCREARIRADNEGGVSGSHKDQDLKPPCGFFNRESSQEMASNGPRCRPQESRSPSPLRLFRSTTRNRPSSRPPPADDIPSRSMAVSVPDEPTRSKTNWPK